MASWGHPVATVPTPDGRLRWGHGGPHLAQLWAHKSPAIGAPTSPSWGRCPAGTLQACCHGQRDAHLPSAGHRACLAWGAALTPRRPPCSLSELREYTEGLGEPAEAEACAPAPGQAVLSLLSAEELRKFIEEVKELDAATLKVGSRLGGQRVPPKPPGRQLSPVGRDSVPDPQRGLHGGGLGLGCSSCKAQSPGRGEALAAGPGLAPRGPLPAPPPCELPRGLSCTPRGLPGRPSCARASAPASPASHALSDHQWPRGQAPAQGVCVWGGVGGGGCTPGLSGGTLQPR